MPNSYKKAVMNNGVLTAPDFVKVPLIIGDGTGPYIWRAAMYGFDESIRRSYGGRMNIEWIEVPAGGRKIPAAPCIFITFRSDNDRLMYHVLLKYSTLVEQRGGKDGDEEIPEQAGGYCRRAEPGPRRGLQRYS